ncbi:putative DNA-binding transcriptional regulator YafY [Gracilibacillus halotolerans]|uniref:Putative DNA-binding transcriptional regulator YafY n=1 Tax=Gracilibacillus halotolerans TaxID=74386 RepID=A0A841RQE8_9BACI|nr:WYL domain-containing protein [Gracilibacillus halotolerans]MBB6513425.1 putative DNA-binding transcriptional regulator YafY [Gracilibacillus halotolerans]
MYTAEKILILDLLKILQKHTDEDHRITQNQIIEILERDYDTSVKRKTVKNNIEKLIRYSEREDANEILYSTKIRKRKNKDADEEEISEVFSDFGYVHDFSNGELRLIIDSILFSKHIPNNQQEELIEKLENLTSKHFNSRMNHIRSVPNSGLKNNDLFYNIEILDEAISKSKQVSFQYNRYDVDEKSRLVLKPQTNQDGIEREYIINPYQMVATNGRYYLVCNNDRYDNISHYRVDRITNIKLLQENRKPMREVNGLEHGLNLPKHMEEHIYVFTGESTSVRLRFHRHFLNEFIDWFGTDNISFSDQTEEELTANVRVNRIALRKWALQYALHVRVLSPESLVDEIKKDIDQARANYQ